MAAHFLEEFVKELESSEEYDTKNLCIIGRPWYNGYGDCVEFKLSGDAYYAERVDEFLTIFRHHENDLPIGFQIKSVATLLDILPIDGLRIEAQFDNRIPTKVSLSSLILKAYKKEKLDSPERDLRYVEVINKSRLQNDEVEVLVPAA